MVAPRRRAAGRASAAAMMLRYMQYCAKKVALPITSAADIPTIPAELFTKFQTSFYSDPVDAITKALGLD